jgi:hypothetical protein
MSYSIFLYIVFSAMLLFVLGGWIRYLLKGYRSRSWPSVTATIQKGAIGRITYGKGLSDSAIFSAYVYVLKSVRYVGFFALYGDEARVRKLHESLAGTMIQIRYDPSAPEVSCLADFYDSRFEGLTATQLQKWLDQAPALDLQEAIRGATGGEKS